MSTRRRSSWPEWRETAKALGARLSLLRKQAGLTQSELAKRLGRTGPGGKSWACQLEQGQMPEVRLGDVLGYLRVCGHGVGAMLDVVEAYTSLPTIEEVCARQAVQDAVQDLPFRHRARVVRYDYKLARELKAARSLEQRVRQAKGEARAIGWERRLHRTWNDVLNELRLPGSAPLAIHLRAYAGKVFAALRRTRKTRPVWRQKAMAKLDSWAAEHELPPEPFAKMKQAVIALFAEMALRGELD